MRGIFSYAKIEKHDEKGPSAFSSCFSSLHRIFEHIGAHTCINYNGSGYKYVNHFSIPFIENYYQINYKPNYYYSSIMVNIYHIHSKTLHVTMV